MTTTTPDMTLEPKHYFRMFWRRKGVILLAVVTVFCSALVALSFMPDEYEATVTINFEEPQASLPEVTPQGHSEAREDARLNAFASRINSQTFLARVVQQLPLPLTSSPQVRAAAEEIYRKNPQLSVDDIALRLVVERIKSKLRFGTTGTGIYQVTVTHGDPATVEQLAKYIGNFYVDDTNRQINEEYEETITWLQDQYKKREDELQEADKKLDEYKRKQINEALPRSSVRFDNLSMAEILGRKARQAADDAESNLRDYAAALSSAGVERTTADATAAQFRKDGEALKNSLIRKIEDYLTVDARTPGEPDWPPTDAKYLDLRGKLTKRIEARVGSTRQTTTAARDAHVDYAFSRIDAQVQSEVAIFLNRLIEDYKKQAQSQPEKESELHKLEQDAQIKRTLLDVFRSHETENKIRQQVQSASLGRKVQVLDSPKLPLSPSRPNRLKILLGALLLGTIFGLGLAFLSEVTDPTVRSIADIQRVAPEPILCTTPLLRTLEPRVQGVRRHWIPVTASAVVLVTVVFFVARMVT